jgi:cytochrome c553
MKRFAAVLLVLGLTLMVAMPAMAAAADDYKAKCQMCHAPDGKGNPAMVKSMGVKDLGSADVQKLSDADLKAAIENGKGKMTGYKGKLNDKQITELVAHVRSFKK